MSSGSSSSTAGRAAVNLGSTTNFAILAETGIATSGVTYITGNIGNNATYAQITGFGLTPAVPTADVTVSATSTLVSGWVYASDYTGNSGSTPTMLTAVVGDMVAAYNDAVGRTNADFTNLGNGEIGGLTLTPGLYKWTTGVTISSNVTLNGGSNDVWIFQIAGVLSTANPGVQVILTGGAQAKNVFWAPVSCTLNGTSTLLQGIVLSSTTITMVSGCTNNGRLLAQTSVTLIGDTITEPAQ
jgi:hypothetical protein